MELSCIIVDDEKLGRDNLKFLIEKHCKDVKILGIAKNAMEGYTLISDHDPDVVFLDINMPDLNGFEMLNLLKKKSFFVIFVTAFAEFAIKAIKIQALDYILKPINRDELKSAVQKAKKTSRSLHSNINYRESYKKTLNVAIESTESRIEPKTITIRTTDEIKIIKLENLVRLEADTNYTKIFINKKSNIYSAKSLKHYEKLLEKSGFIRCHKSHLINKTYIKTMVKLPKPSFELINGVIVNISRRRFKSVLDSF